MGVLGGGSALTQVDGSPSRAPSSHATVTSPKEEICTPGSSGQAPK
jgi:hypothetical protein